MIDSTQGDPMAIIVDNDSLQTFVDQGSSVDKLYRKTLKNDEHTKGKNTVVR